MIVCVCHGIRDVDIERAIAAGATSLDALEDEIALGTGCGSCVEYAEAHLSSRPTPCRPISPATVSEPAGGSPGCTSVSGGESLPAPRYHRKTLPPPREPSPASLSQKPGPGVRLKQT